MQMTQSLELGENAYQTQKAAKNASFDLDSMLNKSKKEANTAEKGSSFLAIMEKMIASNKEGLNLLQNKGLHAGRGAVDSSENQGLSTIKLDSKTQNNKVSNKNHGINQDTEQKAILLKKTKGLGTEDHDESKQFIKKIFTVDTINKKDVFNEASVVDTKTVTEKKQSVAGSEESKKKSNSEKEIDFSLLGYSRLAGSEQVKDASKVSRQETVKIETDDQKTEKITKKEKKAQITVKDERTVLNQDSLLSANLETEKEKSENTFEMSIGLHLDNAENRTKNDSSLMQAEESGRKEQSFASMLSQELRSNASDFVKTGQIVLKDNNSGLIRLTLYPETLGSVQIRLDLSGDKKLSGKIQVSSKEAYEAFSESLADLSDAFIEGGFLDAGFDLSWSGNQQNQNNGASQDAYYKLPFYTNLIPDVMQADSFADIQKSSENAQAASLINVFA